MNNARDKNTTQATCLLINWKNKYEVLSQISRDEQVLMRYYGSLLNFLRDLLDEIHHVTR